MNHISRVDLFLEVAKQRSFTAAAKCLNLSGPAVSKQVQTLENQLGVKLLNRTTRQVTLTEEGAIYAERAGQALEDLHEAERQILELKDCPVGKLRINVPLSFGIAYLSRPIVDFANRYPEVVMDVNYDDRRVDMIAEGYDVLVRIGSLEDSSLIARKLADSPIILCASPDYLKTHDQLVTPDDIDSHRGIVYTKHDNRALWQYIEKDGNIKKINFNRDFSANNAEVMVEACLQGTGIALLPVFSVAAHLQSGELVHILKHYRTYPEPAIYAVFPRNRYLSTKLRLFINHLVENCKKLPW